MSLSTKFICTFNISARLSVFWIATFSLIDVFVVPSPNTEFTFIFWLRICISLLFKSVIISTFSCVWILISTSNVTFMPIFLPFITLHSIIFIFGLMSTSIPSLSSGILKFSEKSRFVLSPLTLSSILSESLSAKYIMYVRIFPSIFNFPSIISFLYIHTFPLVLIVLKMSGFESGTIMSPCIFMISFFSHIVLFTFKLSFVVFISIKKTSSTFCLLMYMKVSSILCTREIAFFPCNYIFISISPTPPSI